MRRSVRVIAITLIWATINALGDYSQVHGQGLGACPDDCVHSHRWRFPLRTSHTEPGIVYVDGTQDFNSNIVSATNDFDAQPELDATLGPTSDFLGDYYNVGYIEGNFGNTGWYGVADVFSNLMLCKEARGDNPATCDDELFTADFAYVYFNNYYRDDEIVGTRNPVVIRQGYDTEVGRYKNYREFVTRHETGHVIALSHIYCKVPSVMNLWCDSQSLPPADRHDLSPVLQGNDIRLIQALY